MNIYTRNGDLGFTTDLEGNKISKSSPKLHLQGSIDEVNSGIGYLRSHLSTANTADENVTFKLSRLSMELKDIQYRLFELGTDISTDFTSSHFTPEDVTKLEGSIDSMLVETGQLSHFICLGGPPPAAWCHVLRSTTRRAERDFVAYLQAIDKETIPASYKYVNRLADLFFQMARYISHIMGSEEETF